MVKSMNTSIHPLDQSFNQDWRAFITTYGALRRFSEQLPALADPLDEQIVEELAEKRLHSYILANTPYTEVAWWGFTVAELEEHHVLFQSQGRDVYLPKLFALHRE